MGAGYQHRIHYVSKVPEYSRGHGRARAQQVERGQRQTAAHVQPVLICVTLDKSLDLERELRPSLVDSDRSTRVFSVQRNHELVRGAYSFLIPKGP